MATKRAYVQVNGLKKHYGDGDARLTVLDGIDTSINRGEICVMLGPSGSRKCGSRLPPCGKLSPNRSRSLCPGTPEGRR